MLLEREDLIRGLRQVIDVLRTRNEPAGIRIVGGAALALRYFDRAATTDVDASLHPGEALLAVATDVAADNGWPSGWLNANASAYIPVAGAEWEIIYEGDGVMVSVASAKTLLAMKLNASRRGRDVEDIANLLSICRIGSPADAESLFEEFYPGEVLPDRAHPILEAIYREGLPDAPPPRAVEL